ncbi:diaminopropionate ammonia-lyase [Sporolactobacillus laevolacticus]|uniref:Diaminopropionate ammonia-lyase n=1 Tax=Sporolactobacillus laevolacticus DSM 442 TaxID=1395513 RepID=V6IVP5_9BACL|nr:diaminopropionate ammonia-lyase [Sporolactobacillus laevolacticus]EST11195.1 diaminopropionate ammonia-lyase [Sporolactobacillus laevolacticus DSM 442]
MSDVLKIESNRRLYANVDLTDVHEFSDSEIEKVLSFQKTHEAYKETPLKSLDAMAEHLNVSKVYVKDESYRFGLNAFKVMGGIYSIACCLAEKLQLPIEKLSFDMLKTGEVKKELGDLTFISATDGNHGRGIAWVARELGLKSVIRMPKGSSLKRLAAIRAEGADAEICDVNYDETVRLCEQIARKNDYLMIQDTAWPGYEKIPLWIMQGYAAIAKEISEQIPEPPTHIFLQAGVGSYAGGIAAYFLHKYPDAPPKIVLVEPDQADCYFQSFAREDGAMQSVGGDMATIMAGLACGEPNHTAFEILSRYTYGAVSCPDEVTALGMRIYGNPLYGDPQVVSGESGAVTMGVLYLLCTEVSLENGRKELGINESSRILLISTEGDTDPQSYREIVWKGGYPNLKRDLRGELNVG